MKLSPRAWIALAVVLIALGVLVALGVAYRGGDSDDDDEGAGTSTEVGTVIEGFRVLNVTDVHETEYKLEPKTIPIERFAYYGFRVVNDGTVTHALRIKGPGLDRKTADIAPGASKKIAVFLNHAGTYKLSCPLDGHEAKGMKATIIVQ